MKGTRGDAVGIVDVGVLPRPSRIHARLVILPAVCGGTEDTVSTNPFHSLARP